MGGQKPGQAAKPQVNSTGSSVAAVGPAQLQYCWCSLEHHYLSLGFIFFIHTIAIPSPIYLGSGLGLSHIYTVFRMVVAYSMQQ